MVYTGLGASISPTTLLPLGRVSIHTVKNLALKEVCTELPPVTYSLLARLSHISICFKKRSDVLRLATPDVPMNSPVESELEASPI